jgi:outer membrane receptor protein involved in Fe transport
MEQTRNQGEIKSQNIKFDGNYVNVFPSVNIRRKITENKNVRFIYGRRINRPTLGQLNPFTDITDSLTQRSGNPALRPEVIDNFELSFDFDADKYTLIAKPYYRYGKNTILAFTELQSNGALFTKLLNVGSTQTLGLESIFAYTASKKWQGNLSLSLFNQTIKTKNLNVEVLNEVLSWTAKWINDFNPWKNGKLQLIGVYNAPTATIQGTRIAVYNVDATIQQKVFNSKGRIGIVITDIFNTQKSGFTWNTQAFDFQRTFKVDTRAILLTFAYTFNNSFKESLMKNQFSND